MPKVFISHTSDGRDFARRLSEALAASPDITIVGELDVAVGQSISQVIRSKLQSSDIIAVLLTERAAQSPWVMFEMGAAEGLGKRVVSVLLADIDVDRLDYLHRDRWFLDARSLTPTETAKRIGELATGG